MGPSSFHFILDLICECANFSGSIVAERFPVFQLLLLTQTFSSPSLLRINVTILLNVKPFSFEFFTVVMAQECMGLFRNCGVYDIGFWLLYKSLGMDSGVFPLRSVEVLEDLAIIAGVDSVSEILATIALLSLLLGELLPSYIFSGVQPCGMFNPCDENGEPGLNIGEVFLTCLLALVFRAFFFCLERSAFKRIMRYASSIEANAQIIANSVSALSSVTKQEEMIASPSPAKEAKNSIA